MTNCFDLPAPTNVLDSSRNRSRSGVVWMTALVAIAALLQGCAYQRIKDSTSEGAANGEKALNHIRQLVDKKDLLDSRPALVRTEKLWMDSTPVALNERTAGAPTTAQDCKITFNPKTAVTVAEFGRMTASLCGVSIQLTADAQAYLNGTLNLLNGRVPISVNPASQTVGAPGARGGALSAGTLPAPNLTGIGNAPAATANATSPATMGTQSSSTFSSPTGDSISGVNWVDKPLSGLLDVIAARLGLGWKIEDSIVTMYFLDTQVFQLYAIPGSIKMNTGVKTGTSGATTVTGSTSSVSANGGLTSEGSTQGTQMNFESDILKDMEKTLNSMITPGMGRVALSSSTGVVTVTDRPDSLRRIKAFISSENKRITRQVVLNVKVLSVSLNKNDSLGLNTAALFKTLSSQVGITTSFVNPNTSGVTTTAGVVSANSDSPWAGSQAVIDALSVQGQVTTITSPSVTTLNMKPAPILVGNQQTYLASVSTTAIQGGGTSQQALTPGTISTGFNMVLLPYLMEGREMLLQFNINMSNLLGISTFTSGANQIQMPNIDNRIFSQSVRLLSGQTLVLSGFDQSGSTGSQQGIADPDLFLAGGRGDATRTRTELVVLITPLVTD